MFKKTERNRKKIVAIVLIFNVLFSLLTFMASNLEVQATSNRYIYNGENLDTNAYPGYKEKLDEIKRKHPNWNIVIMETGLDFNQVVLAEKSFTGNSPYSLIQGKGGAWICSECGSKSYDNGSWYHASEATIRYYLDPRNWLDADSSYFLQFLQIGAVEVSDDDVYNAIKGTFLDKDGRGWENGAEINKASRENSANPFYVIARILQEQGTDGRGSWRIKDEDGTYYYNLFNIGASGNGSSQIIANALAKAKSEGWNSIEKCISGSIKILFSDYINQKQDTIYLNKFDVETYGGLYHQYMQNIEAPKSESALMYGKIKDTGILNHGLTFVIPVFNNMPKRNSESPATMGETGPINIRVKEGHSDINVRESRSTSSKRIALIKNSNSIVLSVERYEDGWHKIVLEDGKIGYVLFNSSYLEEINDITNCYEQVITTGSDINLRAGPGESHTILTTLAYGQQLTRIDNTGRYNINGTIWDRVKLSDGRQGFVSREYIQLVDDVDNVFTVRATGGLFLRTEPTGTNIRLLADGSKVTRTEIGTQEINGYYWDKVTTPDGAVGYVARAYLRDKNGNVPSGKQEEDTPSTEINTKKDDKKKIIYIEPNANVQILKNNYGENISITTKDGSKVENGKIGTGYIVKIEGIDYKVSKLGDANGDGYVNTGDIYVMKRTILENKDIKEEEIKNAIDTNQDGKINTGDFYKLKRKVLNLAEMTFEK